MIIITLFLSLFIFSFFLIKSSDLVILAIRRISKKVGAKVFVLSAIILAVGTSLPEFFVGITSALEGSPNLSLGNVLGANIANISLVAGLSAFILGKVNIKGEAIKKDLFFAFLAGLLPLLLIIDRELSRVDGLILLAVYAGYASSFFKNRFVQIAQENLDQKFVHRFLREFVHTETVLSKDLGSLFIGIALLLFSADVIVRVGTFLASLAGVPVFIVGLVILSMGTTLPELAFSFKSLGNKEPSMFLGNLFGSIIANSTLILGTVSVISPVSLMTVEKYSLAAVAFIIIFITFWFFIRSKHRLDRWEAGVLLVMYLLFLVAEFS